ncbi:MAG: hypothetical protein II323_07075 [Tidjanibacter sp.]|nr:hypothetical protein [Tidjanibacter sp.]
MRKNLRYALLLGIAALLGGCKDPEVTEVRYLASATPTATLYSLDAEGNLSEAGDFLRGATLTIYPNCTQKDGERRLTKLLLDGVEFYAPEENLAIEPRDVVREKNMWVRTPATILGDLGLSTIAGHADKNAELTILDYDSLRADGTVATYRVSLDGVEGYVYGKYLVFTPEEAAKRYKADLYDPIHNAIKNPFGGGKAIGCDFYPVEKPSFEHNPMPVACYSLYLNSGTNVLKNIESYIALAKQSKINTFVIDIKDNESPGFKADAMATYSPTNYKRAGDKEALYRKVVARLHEEGFYVVGRITCFKDSYFVKDNPKSAITEKATGEPFKHNKAFWPSGFDRRVWEFNVALAKEAVEKFGFNEINFDYVRFPDRMTKVEELVDYHNRYGESKVQAIQRFVQYACDEIHKVGAYVSVDVFGESANPGYTTAYGQYWPAISNVADVISGMPYPDHFSNGYYGITKPWNHPYDILYEWGKRVQDRQKVTPTPAVVRTWVQAYNVMRHVDRNGIAYNAENVEKEIRGLYGAGLTGGYITWLASSNIEKYRQQLGAFQKDYYADWRNPNFHYDPNAVVELEQSSEQSVDQQSAAEPTAPQPQAE